MFDKIVNTQYNYNMVGWNYPNALILHTGVFMTQVNDTTTEVTTVTATVQPAVVVPKAPSLKSRATAIFNERLAQRGPDGAYKTNKAFRSAVLASIRADLGVTDASAATMYNSAKKDAEVADPTVGLGRDPKKEKAPSTGKRGRPAGSKNQPKAVVAVTTEAVDTTVVVDSVVEATTEVAPAETVSA